MSRAAETSKGSRAEVVALYTLGASGGVVALSAICLAARASVSCHVEVVAIDAGSACGGVKTRETVGDSCAGKAFSCS